MLWRGKSHVFESNYLSGKYCIGGVIAGDCHAGYFCNGGMGQPDPDDGFLPDGGVCPFGFYCPNGKQYQQILEGFR